MEQRVESLNLNASELKAKVSVLGHTQSELLACKQRSEQLRQELMSAQVSLSQTGV